MTTTMLGWQEELVGLYLQIFDEKLRKHPVVERYSKLFDFSLIPTQPNDDELLTYCDDTCEWICRDKYKTMDPIILKVEMQRIVIWFSDNRKQKVPSRRQSESQRGRRYLQLPVEKS